MWHHRDSGEFRCGPLRLIYCVYYQINAKTIWLKSKNTDSRSKQPKDNILRNLKKALCQVNNQGTRKKSWCNKLENNLIFRAGINFLNMKFKNNLHLQNLVMDFLVWYFLFSVGVLDFYSKDFFFYLCTEVPWGVYYFLCLNPNQKKTQCEHTLCSYSVNVSPSSV